MYVRAQQAICEFDHCVSKIDYCVAIQWLDVTPLRVPSRREDLKTTEPVEQDCDTSEVGVLAQSGSPVVFGLGWGFDETNLITTPTLDSMHVLECSFR